MHIGLGESDRQKKKTICYAHIYTLENLLFTNKFQDPKSNILAVSNLMKRLL